MSDSQVPAPPVNGADNGAPTPTVTPQPKPDLETRIREGGDFALEQYNKMKGENTRLFQKQQKFDPVIKLAEQFGAENIPTWLGEYDSLLKHPEVAKIREHFRAHGVLPTATDTGRKSDNEFNDLFPDPNAEKITRLENELASLRTAVTQTRTRVGKQNVTDMLARLRTESPDGFDEFVLPAISERIDEWEKTPQGRELLAVLDYEQLKTVAGRALFDNRDAIYQRRHDRTLEELKRGATGAPSQTLSTGREGGARSQGYVTARQALEEMRSQGKPLS